jgi:hypothetical protein
MGLPSDFEALAALEKTASQTPNGRWYWGPWEPEKTFTHSKEEALHIAKACLYLGTRVTDVVTSRTWLTLIERLADLEEAFYAGDGHVR